MLIAIDVGYSHTKGATNGRRAIFPSVVGEVQQAHLDLDLAERNGYVQIEIDEGTWFVGDAAIEQSSFTAYARPFTRCVESWKLISWYQKKVLWSLNHARTCGWMRPSF